MLLSDNFIQKYKNIQPPFGGNGFGEIVYLRTYSRWLPDLNRREEWYETVRRVVEYSLSLHLNPYNEPQDEKLKKEAEELFDNIFNLRVFPAGRTLWIGGTDAAKKFPMANFNCTFRVVDSLEAFTEVFYLLMLGCGTGFRVLPQDINQLPKLRKDLKIFHLVSQYNGLGIDKTVWNIRDNIIKITVGDSKEGWVEALKLYLGFLQNSHQAYNQIEFDYINIRPRGSILHTFGGRASGPDGLQEMFENIHNVICNAKSINGQYVKLKPIDALDIMNIIAYNVVVGGVRRSSQIALFDINDTEVLNAKLDLYTPDSKNYGKNWRAMSNNSIYFISKPTKEQLKDIFIRIQHNGEPGFVNVVAANKRRPNFEGINPCAEILLDNRGVCNLTEVNLDAFIRLSPLYGDNLPKEGEPIYYSVNMDGLYKAINNAVRMGLRMTNVELELPEWNKIQKRDRLVGVSLTGVMDAFDKMGWDGDQEEEFLADMSRWANEFAEKYAWEMRIPKPLLVCTIKPSGTISQLPTVSSGIHRSFAPYYIRRMRITSSDPLAKVLQAYNYPIFPETGMGPNRDDFLKLKWEEQDAILQKANTWVAEFPIKTATRTNANDETAEWQFLRYLKFQKYYTNHNASISIYFIESEIDELIKLILYHWNNYIAVSFLPSDQNNYNLIPYEIITEKEYNTRVQSIVPGDEIERLLNDLETQELLDAELDPSCATGICPVR